MTLRPRTKHYEIGNAEFCHLRMLGRLAMEKAIEVDEVVKSSRFDGWLKRLAYGLILSGAVYFGVHVLISIAKGGGN